MELSDFQILCDIRAGSQNDAGYSNGTPFEASIIIATIYKFSTIARVFAFDAGGIIADCIKGPNYYYQQLESFLSKEDSQLKFLIEKLPTNMNCRFFQFLLKEYSKGAVTTDGKKKIDFRVACDSYKELLKVKTPDELKLLGSNELIHFTTGDSNKYRIEYNMHTNEAYYSFSNNEITEEINSDFDEYFEECIPMDQYLIKAGYPNALLAA